MSYRPRGCDSCHEDTSFERRVRCARCDGQVHAGCRDADRVCYACHWYADRKAGGRTMANPSTEGPNPYTRDRSTTPMTRSAADDNTAALLVLAAHTQYLAENASGDDNGTITASASDLDRQIEDIATALANLHTDPATLAEKITGRALRTDATNDLALRARYAAEAARWRLPEKVKSSAVLEGALREERVTLAESSGTDALTAAGAPKVDRENIEHRLEGARAGVAYAAAVEKVHSAALTAATEAADDARARLDAATN